MALKHSSSGSRTKRENRAHHYYLVTRDKDNHVVSSPRWHQPMEFTATILEDGRRVDTGGIKYIVRTKNVEGAPRTLVVTSQKRYSMKNRHARKMLKAAVREKYKDLDENTKCGIILDFSYIHYRHTLSMSTGQTWR